MSVAARHRALTWALALLEGMAIRLMRVATILQDEDWASSSLSSDHAAMRDEKVAFSPCSSGHFTMQKSSTTIVPCRVKTRQLCPSAADIVPCRTMRKCQYLPKGDVVAAAVVRGGVRCSACCWRGSCMRVHRIARQHSSASLIGIHCLVMP